MAVLVDLGDDAELNPSWAMLVALIRITENAKCGSFISQTNNMETEDLKNKAKQSHSCTDIQIQLFVFDLIRSSMAKFKHMYNYIIHVPVLVPAKV